jgi:hypothetical protein
MALPDSPFRCYFALVDPYSIEEAKNAYYARGELDHTIVELVDSSLDQNLKAAALLHEEVVFRGTAPLSSAKGPGQNARKLLTNAKLLLEQGVLVPEVRADDKPLAEQLSKPERFGLDSQEARQCKAIAELIDAAPTKHEADAVGLSQARSTQLADHLFRQHYLRDQLRQPYLESNVSHDDLDSLFSILFSKEPVDRSAFVERCKVMYRNKSHATLLVQTIYFGMGAIMAEANPIFPNHMSLSKGLWSYPELELAPLPTEARKLADKYGIAERLELPKISQAVAPKNVLNIMGIPPEVLDLLDWKDIMRIRQKGETKSMRKKVWDLCRSSADPAARATAVDAVNHWTRKLAEAVLGEMPRTDRVANFQTVLDAAGLAVGMLPVAGTVISLVGLSTDACGRIPGVARRITPLLTYTKLVRDAARRSANAGKEIRPS